MMMVNIGSQAITDILVNFELSKNINFYRVHFLSVIGEKDENI